MAQQYSSADTEQNLSTGKGMVKRQHTIKNFQQQDNPGRMQDHGMSVGTFTESLDVEGSDNGIEFASNQVGTAEDLLLNDLTSSTEAHPLRGSQLSSMYSGEWPTENELINNGPISLNGRSHSANSTNHNSSLCYSSSGYSPVNLLNSSMSIQPLGTKVEMVYSLLSMLDTHGKDEMSLKLLEMSKSTECCIAMRQSGCLPLLVQILHGNQRDSSDDESNTSREAFRESRQHASQALHNIVHAHPDDKRGRREARVLRMLEQIRDYCDAMRDIDGQIQRDENANKVDDHPGPAIAALMKLSFDEEHRHAICQLGGLQAIAELIKVDHDVHGNTSDSFCLTLRRYAGMALTNLTFGDGTNKALLCSMKPFMQSLVSQLHSPNEDLRQVTASVLRNLSWRADSASKKALRSVGVVTTLTKSAMEATKESTLKSILSALWNLSAHCSNNKADICAVDGALAFLVSTLMYKSLSKTLSVVENGGGILRNISSHVALCEEYRAVLRKHNCLQILLEHLKSPSLTIVSNACGTLWNLSARCIQDQRILWELGAVNMLRRLIHSRHKMIAMGSSAALKNLVTAKIPGGTTYSLSSMYESGHFGSNMPSLYVRKQRALEAEIDHNLSETYDNIDSPKNSPTHNVNLENRFFMFQSLSQPRYAASLPSRIYDNGNSQIRSQEVSRSDSHDSLGSSHSEPLYPHLQSGAFRLISKNAKFVSPDHRHYSVKIAEWKDFQLSPLKDSCIPFGKCPVLLNPSYSFNDCSITHSESSKHCSDGNNLSNVYEFTKSDNQVNLNSKENNVEPKEANNLDEIVICDKDSDKIQTNNVTTSTIGDSITIKPTSHLSKLATIAQKIDLFNIEDQDVHEQPIDYSLKYREENMALLPDTCNQRDHNEHPPPKINNYLQATTMSSRPLYKDSALSSAQCVSHWNSTQLPHSKSDEKNTTDCIRDTYSTRSFPENDTDNLDQPTDFSQKYAEHVDPMDLHHKDNNKLFEHCSEETQFNSPETKHPYINDDTVKVYCTEDTPLNFSSASSLTDLRDIHMTTLSDTYALKETKDVRKVEIESSSQAQNINSCNLKDSIDRNSVEAVSEKKETEKSNLSPRKATCNVEKEGKSVTFGEEVNYAEETPLMFSRCSSLGSLSSFEQHSIHDDHSSVISDFSRRASEVVSPSDLPDSPSQTLPPSPRRDKPSIFTFAEKPLNNDTEDTSPNLSSKTKNTSMFEDSRISFSEEGMPPEFSRTTSLSSLTIEDELKIPKELKLKDGRLTIQGDKFQIHEDTDKSDKLESPLQSGQTTSEKDSGPSSNEPSPSDDIEDKSDISDAESAEDDILAACINSGMPNNNGYSNGLNNTKLRSKVNNLSAMSLQLKVSNIPTKSSNIRYTPPVSNISKSLGYGKSATSSNMSHRENFGEDSLKVYKTEDTPSSLSHATSLSDLSNISCTDSNRSNEAAKSNRDNHSDSSSVCDENDNLLLKCIQSGMPQSKKRQVPREADRCGDGASSPDNVHFKSKLPLMNLRKSSDPIPLKVNVLTSSQFKPQNNVCQSNNNTECKATKMYFPPSHNWQHVNRDKRVAHIRGHQRSHSISVSPQSCSNHGTNGTYSYGLPESPKTYETEGTPVNFSCNDSLSSLSCEDDSDLREQKKINLGYIEKTSKKMVPKSPNVSLTSHIPNSHLVVAPSNTNLASERYNQGYTFSQRIASKNHFENGSTKQSYSPSVISKENKQDAFQEQDSIHASQIEGTPVCFSRNSSLSSLSMDSTDEPSSSEQALLEECISFGMPKDKSVKNKYSPNKSKLSFSESKLPIRDYDQLYKHNKQKKTNNSVHIDSVIKCLSSPVDNEVSEEKGMEDERTKEKQKFVSFGSLNDTLMSVIHKTDEAKNVELLEEFHEDETDYDVSEKYEETDHNLQQDPHNKDVTEDRREEKNENDDTGLSVSTVIKLEAEKIGEAIEELVDDMTQSSISCTSDIENVNPPSAMDLNISLSTSGTAEWFTNKPDSNFKPKSLGKRMFKSTYKQIPEPVRRALAGNLDVMKISAGSDILCNLKPPSAMGSVENLSMKSSCTSELLENVNPPSLMDEISMVGSSASLNSVSSGILENPIVEVNYANDMYEKLNAAATMVQVYSREYATITNGSSKSSRSTDIIEHVKPPSMTHNITEFTIEDATEFASDTMESDTEIGEDLPCDDDTGSETLKATNISPLTKDEPYEGSTENLVSSFTDTDTLEYERSDCNSNHMETGHPLEDMNITAEEMLVLQENAQLVVTTLNEIQMTGSSDSDPDAVNSNEMIEDETLSLVSNESDDDLPANEDSISEKTMSEVSNDCTLQDDDLTQNSNVSNINTNTFTKKPAFDSSTFTRMKVPKTKDTTTNSSNNTRMIFQSQNNDDSVATYNISSSSLQNETCDDDNQEVSTAKVVQESEKAQSAMQIVQGSFTEEKFDPESSAKTKAMSTKKANLSKDSEVVDCQNTKIDKSNKRPERKIPIGQSRISQYTRTPSGPRSARSCSSGSRNTTGNQIINDKRENIEKSSSRCPSSASISTRSGSLGSCSNSNASLSSVSSSGTLPDKSSGSGKKEVGSKVASIWKTKEKTSKPPGRPLPANKSIVSPKATCVASSYSARKPATSNRLQSPVPSTPSPCEGMSRSSTYEKLSAKEGKEESPAQKTVMSSNPKNKNKIATACTRLDQSKPSSEINRSKISTASNQHIKGQHIPTKDNSRGHIPPPGSKSRLPTTGQRISPKMSPQRNENKGSCSENKPVSAIVIPFNYNPSTNIPKSKNDVVPSKSMIPSPKNISSRTSTSSNSEGSEGKRVRRTCLVTMV